MNAGFSSLDRLKQFLLAEDLREQTTYDEALTRLGLGVAAAIDRHCNRTFARGVDVAWECPADREHITLPRYPVEAIESIEIRETSADSWSDITDQVAQWDAASGLVHFTARPGRAPARLRVTWTGGYWWSPDDDEEAPEGAAVLPEDIRTAWLLQCEALWLAHDGLGTGMVKPRESALLGTSLAGIDIIPTARAFLAPHIRYATL